MYNFDMVKVLYNYKKFQKDATGITISFAHDHHLPNFIKILDENNVWVAYLDIKKDQIYHWRERTTTLPSTWVLKEEKVSDYE